MTTCDCKDKSQCWEPCGELGHSEEHVIVVVGAEDDAPCAGPELDKLIIEKMGWTVGMRNNVELFFYCPVTNMWMFEYVLDDPDKCGGFHPSQTWTDGGPFIYNYKIATSPSPQAPDTMWEAVYNKYEVGKFKGTFKSYGTTPLEAAMKVLVLS